MPDIKITIKNAAQIRDAFAKAPRLMTVELNKAIRKSILTIQRQSMINTPVDTGRLRASTYSKFGNLKGETGTDTNYDIFVHNGTRFLKARPYLADAVTEEESSVDRFFTEAVDSVLSSIARST